MARTAVQTGFNDAFSARFPGQIIDFGTSIDNTTRGFPCDGGSVCGRGVVKSTLITDVLNANSPFMVKAPINTNVLADFVGITIRTEACRNDVNGNAYYPDKTMATATFRIGGGALIGANANATVVHGDPVYMSIDVTQTPFLAAGEFTNASGAGVIAITGATWYGAHTSGTVGVIQI